jgi:hypothetical protein
MCGLDIDVPEYASKLRPWLPGGATAATTSTPGAVMSGLSRSPLPAMAGPADEKLAISGARTWVTVVAESDAVAPAVAAYALIARPAALFTWTVGTWW